MESKFKNFVNENKIFLVFYLIWFLMHLIFLSVGGDYNRGDELWPFDEFGIFNFDLDNYQVTEFIFYLIAPIILWIIWKLVGSGFIILYLIWFLIHLIFLSIGDGREGFWPFIEYEIFDFYGEYEIFDFDLDYYGITEFIFYLIVPLFIWSIWKLVGNRFIIFYLSWFLIHLIFLSVSDDYYRKEMITAQEFLTKIREKYPVYNDIPDDKLYNAFMEKFPEKRKYIKDTEVLKPGDKFWPFNDKNSSFDFDLYYYQVTEFIFYLLVPIFIWSIWKIVSKNKKRSLEDKN